MTRVNSRSKAKNGKINGQGASENTKDNKECVKQAKEVTKHAKVKEVKVKGMKTKVETNKGDVHVLENPEDGSGEDPNLDLTDFEDLLKGVKVEGNEDESESEEEEEEEEDDEDMEDTDADEDLDEDAEELSAEELSANNVIVLKEDMNGKIIENGDVRYKCGYCDYSFARNSMLKRHVRIHTGEKPYECQKCDAKFTQQGGLKTHMLCKHQDELNQEDRVKYQCHHCERSFLIKERLRIHLRVHTGELPYICHICSKRFRRNGGLLQHLRRHIGMRPYTCEICKASYYNSTNLKTHMKRHLGVQDYVCEICGKGFTRRDGLRKHLACLHYDQCAFRCSICNKSFKGHILSHLRMHLKEKPFKCEQCGMRFVQSSQLVVHKRTHTGAKPYPCQICKVAFSHSSALRMHIRRHTGEKPVKCLLCPAAFVQLPHLKKHMRCIHKSEKPYVCVPCYEFFRTKAELEEHKSFTDCKPNLECTASPTLDIPVIEIPQPDSDPLAIPGVSAADLKAGKPGDVSQPLSAASQTECPKTSKRGTKRKAEKVVIKEEIVDADSASVKKSSRSVAAPKEAKNVKDGSSESKKKTAVPKTSSSRAGQNVSRITRKSSSSADSKAKSQDFATSSKSRGKASSDGKDKLDRSKSPEAPKPKPPRKSRSPSENSAKAKSTQEPDNNGNTSKPRTRTQVSQNATCKELNVLYSKLNDSNVQKDVTKLVSSSSSGRRSSIDMQNLDTALKLAALDSQGLEVNIINREADVDDPDEVEPKRERERSESPAGVSLITLPICEPLKPVDQPHTAMVEEMMLAVTNRLKLGTKPTGVVVRTQPMPIEKIRMLLAILLTRISTPERLKSLGFGKILIDEVLCASIISSGRVPCDKTGLTEREVILKNSRILLDWTVPKVYMERFRRDNRSTEDLLEELTS